MLVVFGICVKGLGDFLTVIYGVDDEVFGVHHESPQILLIKSGECTYDESHLSITLDDLKEQLNSN